MCKPKTPSSKIAYFPHGFFNKEINEPFIQRLLSYFLEGKEWNQGDPNKKEPDYFCDSIPIEFTIASDKKKLDSFIQRLKEGTYNSDDVERDAIIYIKHRLEEKAKKAYCVPNVHLCILFPLELTNWLSDYSGSYLSSILDSRRAELFEEIRIDYINTNRFKNIFIMFPCPCAKWWLYDVLNNQKVYYELSEDEIIGGKYPFLMDKYTWENHYLKKAARKQKKDRTETNNE
ncbi:MAG: hypothetical protein J5854_02450 [Clostridia bacterium]|nr:hypothetical protein [Clostridia bacterium]